MTLNAALRDQLGPDPDLFDEPETACPTCGEERTPLALGGLICLHCWPNFKRLCQKCHVPIHRCCC